MSSHAFLLLQCPRVIRVTGTTQGMNPSGYCRKAARTFHCCDCCNIYDDPAKHTDLLLLILHLHG
jgi:hypothetical protein